MTPNGHCQASTFITKSDNPLYSSDGYTLSSDTLLEYGDATPLGGSDDPPMDSDETSFTDLFTEPESSQDTGSMVCDYLRPSTHLISDPGHTSCNFNVYGHGAAAEILIFQMIRFETFGPDMAHLSEENADAFTLAGLDYDWESIDLKPNPTQRQEHSFLDGNDLGCMALDPDAPSTGFLWHATTHSDVPRFDDLDAATLDQPVLDLDSDDEEMGDEEAVLVF